MKKKFIIVHSKRLELCRSNNGKAVPGGEVDIYYHLYENGFRERKVTHNVSGATEKEAASELREVYQMIYLPWINGVDHADIQSYEHARQNNAMVALKRPAV